MLGPSGAKLGTRWLAEKEKPSEEVLGSSGSEGLPGFGDIPECRHSRGQWREGNG